MKKSRHTNNFESPSKKDIIEDIKSGLNEAKMHIEGKIKLRSAREFLNDLRD